MKEINYLEIIKKSWKITWGNKNLWWFGLFLALGGGIGFNFPGNSEWNKKIGENGSQVENFMNQNWQLIVVIVSFAVIAVLVLLVLKLISKAGLIKTLNKIEKSSNVKFKEGFKEGKKYFWKMLVLGLILGITLFCIFVVLIFPVVFLFSSGSIIFGILAALLAFSIFVPLIILASFLGKYANYYIILSELGVEDSIERSYQVFRKNILVSIIMSLFFIPINIALAITALGALLVVGLCFLLVGIVLYLILAKIGIIIAVSLGGLVFIVFLILINSVFQVFYQTVWFLFFKEIASVKEEEKIEETAVEIAQKNIPTPEEA